jgi:hypothetical protein
VNRQEQAGQACNPEQREQNGQFRVCLCRVCVLVCDCDASSPVRIQAGSCRSRGRNIGLGLRVVLGSAQVSRNDINCSVGSHASSERLCFRVPLGGLNCVLLILCSCFLFLCILARLF